jgi:hypothetical protein
LSEGVGEQTVWFPVDQHPAVLAGIISADQLRAAERQRRCRSLWLSARRLRVHRDALDDIERSGRPS